MCLTASRKRKLKDAPSSISLVVVPGENVSLAPKISQPARSVLTPLKPPKSKLPRCGVEGCTRNDRYHCAMFSHPDRDLKPRRILGTPPTQQSNPAPSDIGVHSKPELSVSVDEEAVVAPNFPTWRSTLKGLPTKKPDVQPKSDSPAKRKCLSKPTLKRKMAPAAHKVHRAISHLPTPLTSTTITRPEDPVQKIVQARKRKRKRPPVDLQPPTIDTQPYSVSRNSLPTPNKERCRYWDKCYQQNPEHRAKFLHPGPPAPRAVTPMNRRESDVTFFSTRVVDDEDDMIVIDDEMSVTQDLTFKDDDNDSPIEEFDEKLSQLISQMPDYESLSLKELKASAATAGLKQDLPKKALVAALKVFWQDCIKQCRLFSESQKSESSNSPLY